MSVNVKKVLSYAFMPKDYVYTERDVSLYSLSIGVGQDPTNRDGLKFVYELHPQFAAFPTMAVIFPFTVFWQILEVPGLEFNPMMLLHGEQKMALRRPLPTSGTISNHARIANIYDKGSGAVIVLEVSSIDEAGEEVALNQSTLFIRGLGGFGGERGPSSKVNLPPERVPDAIVTQPTRPEQALIYRLASGDRNPLHADPQMAALGGFDQPILHGLCTFGFAVRAVMAQFGTNDPTCFKSVQVRFSKHFFPGETLVTEMWQMSANRIVFQAKAKEREELVLSNALVELHRE